MSQQVPSVKFGNFNTQNVLNSYVKNKVDYNNIKSIEKFGTVTEEMELDFSKIAISAQDVLDGNFLDEATILIEYWESDNEDLTYEIRDDGAVLILKDGVALGWTTKDFLIPNDKDISKLVANTLKGINDVVSIVSNDENSKQQIIEKKDVGFLEKTGATIGNFLSSTVEGIGKIGESVFDLGAWGRYVGQLPFHALSDGYNAIKSSITGEEWESKIVSKFNDTKAFTTTEYVATWFDDFYDDTSIGNYLKENSWAYEGVRTAGNITGELIPSVILAYLTCGGSMATTGSTALTTTSSTSLATTGSAAVSANVASNVPAIVTNFSDEAIAAVSTNVASNVPAIVTNFSDEAIAAATKATVTGTSKMKTIFSSGDEILAAVKKDMFKNKKEAMDAVEKLFGKGDTPAAHSLKAEISNWFKIKKQTDYYKKI